MARCPAAKRRDEAVTGSHPFSSKASYRYPRKKTSSGRATRIAWRKRRAPREETPAPGERGKRGRGRAETRKKANAPPAPSARKKTTFCFATASRFQVGARPRREDRKGA